MFIDQALHKAMESAVMSGPQGAFDKKRQAVLDRLVRLGVPCDRVLSFFGKTTLEQIDSEDLKVMIGVGTSIKEGMLGPEEAFVVPPRHADTVSALIPDNDVSDTQEAA